jgi:hypothetical protein
MINRDKQKGFETIFPFFEFIKQKPYQTEFELIGQSHKDSCLAAVIKMLLSDFRISQPEAYISSVLEMKDGAYLSKVPSVLSEFGLDLNFKWRTNLTFEELKTAVINQRAIVSVKRVRTNFGHALIIDAIIDGEVRLRDPLPLGIGRSYAVSIEDFKNFWLRNDGLGIGVIYDDKQIESL